MPGWHTDAAQARTDGIDHVAGTNDEANREVHKREHRKERQGLLPEAPTHEVWNSAKEGATASNLSSLAKQGCGNPDHCKGQVAPCWPPMP